MDPSRERHTVISLHTNGTLHHQQRQQTPGRPAPEAGLRRLLGFAQTTQGTLGAETLLFYKVMARRGVPQGSCKCSTRQEVQMVF